MFQDLKDSKNDLLKKQDSTTIHNYSNVSTVSQKHFRFSIGTFQQALLNIAVSGTSQRDQHGNLGWRCLYQNRLGCWLLFFLVHIYIYIYIVLAVPTTFETMKKNTKQQTQ